MLSKAGNWRKGFGSTFFTPGRSQAQTTASNSRSSSRTWRPVIFDGRPSAPVSYAMSRIAVRRLILAPRSSRYLTMGSWRNVCGDPSSMRSTDASVRIAKSMKIVSMHRAEILSQSMKPSA